MLEWRCWYLVTCFLWELNTVFCAVSCKSQLLSAMWRHKNMHIYIADNGVGEELLFCICWASSMEAEEINPRDVQIRGNGKNLGCKRQTTSVFYIYVDAGFERKWENCFNEALSYCWERFHSDLILPAEILSVKPQFQRLAKLPYPSEFVMIPPDFLVELCSPGPYNRNCLGYVLL